ncbi:Protein kinase domain-containing protein ppk32 [Coemansia sp. RSA 1822]|nr:Protein kinase domain-containing protein ppk32 [Coemansia sp. RSA 638]KAJ2560960.1 Protein kinase domain-containing protein ppk32 [Coemansia sp. RSA 1822]
MDTYINKLRGLASAAAGAVQSKAERDYEFTVSAHTVRGTSGLWTLYDATRHSTQQLATVWVFDKRFFASGLNRQLLDSRARTLVTERLMQEAGHLARLRHPNIVQLMEPIEDTRTSLVFVTERVAMSLADVLASQSERAELDELEIQEGLLCVSRALQFLHTDARRVHGNLAPSSVLIGPTGEWKLGGLGFSQSTDTGSASEYALGFAPTHTRPELEYAAPECMEGGRTGPASDVFAFGCLIAAVHSSDGRSPLEAQSDVGAYRRAAAALGARVAAMLSDPLSRVVQQMVAVDATQRLTLQQFQSSAYFDGVLAATLRYLASLIEQPADQKIAFMRGLPQVLPKFPPRVLKRQVLPHLLSTVSDHKLLRFTMPCVFYVAEQLSKDEFTALVLPELRPIFAMGDQQPHAVVVVLEHLQLLQSKMHADTFRSVVMPLVYAALLSSAPVVQDHALQQAARAAEAVSAADVRDQLVPRIQQVYSKASILSLKVRALRSLRELLKLLDKPTIVGKIMPMLKRTKSRDPTVVMAMLDMYEEIGSAHLDRQSVATEILPVLWTQLADDRLRLAQFERFVGVVQKLQERVLNEHRRHLEQIQRVDDQAERFNEAAIISDTSVNGDAAVNGDLFASIIGSSKPNTPQTKTSPVLQNPLAGLSAANTASATSDWEWDAPTAPTATTLQPNKRPTHSMNAPAFSSSRVSVEVDFMSTDGQSDTTDDFGAFTAFPPPPSTTKPLSTKPALSNTASAKPAPFKPAPLSKPASRLRTSTPVQNKLGATRIGSESRPFQFGATKPLQSSQKPLQSSQKHAGGKATDLGDFDPYA